MLMLGLWFGKCLILITSLSVDWLMIVHSTASFRSAQYGKFNSLLLILNWTVWPFYSLLFLGSFFTIKRYIDFLEEILCLSILKVKLTFITHFPMATISLINCNSQMSWVSAFLYILLFSSPLPLNLRNFCISSCLVQIS